MAAKESPGEDRLNALIPSDLKRRMKIAAANTGKPMTTLLIEWIEKGLAEVEKGSRGKNGHG